MRAIKLRSPNGQLRTYPFHPPMNLYVGTSGYAYKAWKGNFYPTDLPDKGMLHFYAEHFHTVEINNTFYRMPTAALLNTWAMDVPADFKFVLKAPQQITHHQRLHDSDEATGYLFDTAATLKTQLGAILFQLPPNLKKDLPRLHDFLDLLPPQHHTAFEFRHASWFDDEVFELLHDNHVALCIAETDGELIVPIISTADWGYLRLRRPDYGDKELNHWVKQVRQQKWQDVFVFFKHEDAGRGPQLARRFLELAAI